MTTNTTSGPGPGTNLRNKVGAILCGAAIGAAALTGCGSESPEGSAGVAESAASTSSDHGEAPAQSEEPSGDGLPEGFPADDIPLPQFTTAHKVGGSSDAGYWVVLLELGQSTDTPVEDYAAQLTDAGYTVEDGSGGKEAVGPDWEISFHSAMAQTVTISVMGT